MEYTLALRAIYKHGKVEIYKDSNINGEFGIYKSGALSNSSVPIEKAGIIGDGSFNLGTDYEISTKGTSNFSLGSNDFTLSFWFNVEASTGKNIVLLSVANNNILTAAGTFMLLCNPLRLAIQNNIYIDATETLNLADGKNHFISIVRKDDMFYVFIDGKKEIEDNLETRYKTKDFSFPVTDFAINSGSCNDSDSTPTIKRKIKVDSFSLIQGAGLWTDNFTVPSLDVWDGMSQGFLDTNGLKHYHKKIVEYINKNSDAVTEWASGESYKINQFVTYGNCLYISSVSHTAHVFKDDFSKGKWVLLKNLSDSDGVDTSTVSKWKTETDYKTNQLVLHDDSLYMCLYSHTSEDFDKDLEMGYWKRIDSDQTVVGGVSGYSQITQMGVTATATEPKNVIISINETPTYCLPPVEVLKYVSTGESTVTPATFDKDEAKQYTYDKDSVDFDGSMHIKTEFDINSSEPVTITDGTTTGYISESDTIDFSRWKSVDSIGIS